MEGLKGKADKEGYEADGNITVGELASCVYKEQHRLAMEKGVSDEEKSQLPFIYPRNGYFDPGKGIILEGLAQGFHRKSQSGGISQSDGTAHSL